MANTSDIRNGLCIDFNSDIVFIVEFQHVKPGKGNAFVRTKLKSFKTGKVFDHTFPAGHKLQVIRVERRKVQYLYTDDFGYNFMDNESYEQFSIEPDMIPNRQYLKEGSDVEILFNTNDDSPLSVDLPKYLVLEITYTEPGVKGDTATNSTKPATVETGAEIRVPLFINQGDKVKIESANGSYVERAK